MNPEIRYHGLYRGKVVATNDPENLGRVTLRVPQVSGQEVTNWAWPVLSGYVPSTNESCWVMFEGGDPNFPLWVGMDPELPTDTSFEVTGGSYGTQPTFSSDPLFSGSYVRSGDQVHFQIQVEFDNITGFGTGQYYVDLPFTAKYNYQFAAGCLHDISTSIDYPIFGHVLAGAKRMRLKSIDAQGNSAYNVDFTSSVPITLTTADNFHISGDYITDEAI